MIEKQKILDEINAKSQNTLMQTLGIVFTDIGEDFLEGTMPVNTNVHQPYGVLHGGASVAFAESLGSMLSNLLVMEYGQIAVGTNINANHLKSKKEGVLLGRARLIRKGKNLHFCEIELRDERQGLICHITMTNMIITKN